MKNTTLFTLYSSLFTLLLAACSLGGYESGDGNNSYLQSSFGELQTNSSALVSSLSLDNGSTVALSEAKAISGAKADTLYRGLIYYSTADNKTRLIGFTRSLVCSLNSKSLIKNFVQDPVGIESAWISKNCKYLNLTLLTQVGETTDGGRVTLALALDHKSTMPAGGYHYYISLYHKQSTVPEYYTDKTYLSLPLTTIQPGDSITIDYTDSKSQVSSYKLQVK